MELFAEVLHNLDETGDRLFREPQRLGNHPAPLLGSDCSNQSYTVVGPKKYIVYSPTSTSQLHRFTGSCTV